MIEIADHRAASTAFFDRSSAPRWLVAIVAILVLLFAVPAPAFPQDTLDGAWILAAEHAVRTGAVFGRDFVLTYGPFAVLSTGLFAPDSWAWVLVSGIALGIAWLGPLFHARRPYLLLLYGLAIPVMMFWFDARVVVAMLSVCLMAMMRPSWWSIMAAAGWGAIALSKFSYALVALPLMLLIDVHGVLAWRRAPLHTIILLVSFGIGMTASGTDPGWWAEVIRNNGEVISAYSGAMQLAMRVGGAVAMLGTLAFAGVVLGYFAWLLWCRRGSARKAVLDTLFPLLAVAWCLWMAFKMGFVRADSHMLITWSTLTMAIPAMFAVLETRAGLTPRQRMTALAMMLGAMTATLGIGVKALSRPDHGPRAVIDDYVAGLLAQPMVTLGWLTPGGWRNAIETRVAAEARIRRRFPWPDGTTADVIPQRLTPVIVSNLSYRPRPIPQSYSSFTPLLQTLDARHFASPRAPDLLFVDVFSEIDDRLPTLSLGPSLPVIARRYNVVGSDPALGAVLHRRAVPRPVREMVARPRTLAWGAWLPLPATGPRQMIGATFDIRRGLIARATGLLAREPVIFIELSRIDGRIDRYRLVPGMGHAGVVLSPSVRDPNPLVTDPDRAIGMLVPGSRPNATIPVVAIRLVGDPLAPHAYGAPVVGLRSWTIDSGR